MRSHFFITKTKLKSRVGSETTGVTGEVRSLVCYLCVLKITLYMERFIKSGYFISHGNSDKQLECSCNEIDNVHVVVEKNIHSDIGDDEQVQQIASTSQQNTDFNDRK